MRLSQNFKTPNLETLPFLIPAWSWQGHSRVYSTRIYSCAGIANNNNDINIITITMPSRDREDVPVSCATCRREYQAVKTFNRHYKDKHAGETAVWTCSAVEDLTVEDSPASGTATMDVEPVGPFVAVPAPALVALGVSLVSVPGPASVVPKVVVHSNNRPQLRSSRTTRNQEHNPANRNRAGVIDWDPTDGLPVRKWEQLTVKVNQDTSNDPSDANNQSTEHNDSDFPWPEQPLPHFFNQLPPHSQVSTSIPALPHTSSNPRPDFPSQYMPFSLPNLPPFVASLPTLNKSHKNPSF